MKALYVMIKHKAMSLHLDQHPLSLCLLAVTVGVSIYKLVRWLHG